MARRVIVQMHLVLVMSKHSLLCICLAASQFHCIDTMTDLVCVAVWATIWVDSPMGVCCLQTHEDNSRDTRVCGS